MGCAVACVAARLGLSYSSALKLFAHPEYAWTRGFYCGEIVDALGRAGLNYAYSKFDLHRDRKNLVRSGTIAFVDPCEVHALGHFYLRTHRGWMNPWANFPKIKDVQARYQLRLPSKVGYVVFEKPRPRK